jgi:hypothetical protein
MTTRWWSCLWWAPDSLTGAGDVLYTIEGGGADALHPRSAHAHATINGGGAPVDVDWPILCVQAHDSL